MNKCVGSVYDTYTRRSMPHGVNAKYEHEGKWYCGTHHPPKVQKRQEKSHMAWEAKHAIKKEYALANAYALVAEDLGITVAQLKEQSK